MICIGLLLDRVGVGTRAVGCDGDAWKNLKRALAVAKGSRCFVDEHYDDVLVRQLGDTQAAQMVSFAEEPPGKMLVNAAERPSSSASGRSRSARAAAANFSTPVTPLMLSRMLSNEWYNDEDINATIWRLRFGIDNGYALAPSLVV